MRISRTLAGVLSAALLGAVPVSVVAAPAHAANYSTVTTLKTSYNKIEYKGYASPILNASVTASDGSSVYYGTVDLYAKTAKSGWNKIRSADAGGYVSFSDVKPAQNTQYRAVYSGGSSSSNTYTASSTGTLKVNVFRKLTIKNPKGTLVKGKVAPKYKKKKIVIKKKVGKKWKKFRTLRTNKKSRFSITLPASRKRTYWQIIVPGNKQFVKSVFKGSTIRY